MLHKGAGGKNEGQFSGGNKLSRYNSCCPAMMNSKNRTEVAGFWRVSQCFSLWLAGII